LPPSLPPSVLSRLLSPGSLGRPISRCTTEGSPPPLRDFPATFFLRGPPSFRTLQLFLVPSVFSLFVFGSRVCCASLVPLLSPLLNPCTSVVHLSPFHAVTFLAPHSPFFSVSCKPILRLLWTLAFKPIPLVSPFFTFLFYVTFSH